MHLSKKLVLALAGAGLVAPVAASAQEIASLSGRAAISEYTQQQAEDRFMAWESKNQVTSVTQFSDVQPTDWAYQALSNLVEKYGCVAGYPDGTFKGKQALSRYEAAALLNSCLDRVTEVTDELQKLLNEFKVELATLKGRVDGLDKKVGKLEAQQFSTTTKLKGEASFVLGGVPGYGYTATNGGSKQRYGSTTFNYDLRLNFDTSYTGQDLLRTRLRSGNFSDYPFGSSSTPFKLEKAENYGNGIYVDRLYYTFPVDKNKTTKLTVGALVRNTEITWLPTAYKSNILDFFSVAGTPGVYNKATGEGVGIEWKQKVAKGKGAWVFNANYIVSGTAGALTGSVGGSKNGASGANSSYGIFDSNSGLNALAQIGYKANNWGAAIGYRYGSQGAAIRDGNGAAGAALSSSTTDPAYTNSLAFNAYWQPIHTGWLPSISAGYGFNVVSGAVASSTTNSSRSWNVGFQWDDAFVKGNAAGIAFGQAPYSNYSVAGTQAKPFLVEWFYRFQVSDNISITPALFYASGVANSAPGSSTTGGNGANNSAFNGLGGVIQTTFKF